MYDTKSFKKSFRGFDRGEVLEFLQKQEKQHREEKERAEREIRLRDKAIAELKLRLTRKEEELVHVQEDIERKYKPYISNYEQIGELVYQSKVRSEEALVKAREEADRIVSEGREKAERAVREAEERAKKRAEIAEGIVADKVAEGKKKYLRIQTEMNTIIDIVNEAQRRFIQSYKDIHQTIQNVPNRLYESELMDQIDRESAAGVLPPRMPVKPVDIDDEIDDLDEEFDLFVHKFTNPKE
ncbi:MAG: hypothetical protein ACSW75_03245 [Lachnospiraceae bacterium]